jgi:hypothetical protein
MRVLTLFAAFQRADAILQLIDMVTNVPGSARNVVVRVL